MVTAKQNMFAVGPKIEIANPDIGGDLQFSSERGPLGLAILSTQPRP